MRNYSNKIALIKNDRGIYSLDTSIGCSSGMKNNTRGCYNDCYAAKSAKLYGYDFSKTIFRFFENNSHKQKIIKQISKIKLDFVRIGTSGDPSEDWQHTLNICIEISKANKEIVIITKHWTMLTNEQLISFSKLNVCINTSISALDTDEMRLHLLSQYERIKKYCKSILRIVSCEFNHLNETGLKLSFIQDDLFKNKDTLDTVFRPNKNNPLVKDGVILVSKSKFLGKSALISKFNKKTYFGKCSSCQEMCGVRIFNDDLKYSSDYKIIKQLKLF
jgi:hypothetical protein